MTDPAGAAGRSAVLIVDDDPINVKILVRILRGEDFEILQATDGESALKIAAEVRPTLILLDVNMPPGIDGYEVARRLKADPETANIAIVFCSGRTEPQDKVEGLELGAVDYVAKPYDKGEVLARVRTHLTLGQLRQQVMERNAALEHELSVARRLMEDTRANMQDPLIGSSDVAEDLRKKIEATARLDAPVLVQGPPGAGHEGVARAIHHHSDRRNRAFIHVDCLTLSDSERGTLFDPDAIRGPRADNRWKLAAGGTLCLENLSALSDGALEKCGAYLQTRLGSTRGTRPQIPKGARAEEPLWQTQGDARVIILSVTRGAPSSAVAGGHLDSQVFAAQMVALPPLSQRVDDIEELVDYLVKKKARKMGRTIRLVGPESLSRLKAYSWPGNIDELASVVECAISASDSEVLDVDPALLDKGSRAGHYQLEERIGGGAMGDVWLARHRLLAQPAAVKLIRSGELERLGLLEQARARFEREARATAALESPHTVRLFDYGVTDGGDFYYVMERLRGMDLARMVERFGPMPAERAIHFLAQACVSLAEAHDAGMVHRDIKPANLFACALGHQYDVLKVLDFGMVRPEHQKQDANLTGGGLVGTPTFMAPEMILSEEVDSRADIYCLGCVGFMLVTGHAVFESESVTALFAHHAGTPAPRVSAQGARVPRKLEKLIARCLEKDPGKRPGSAWELRELLFRARPRKAWDEDRAADWWMSNTGLEQRTSKLSWVSGSLTPRDVLGARRAARPGRG